MITFQQEPYLPPRDMFNSFVHPEKQLVWPPTITSRALASLALLAALTFWLIACSGSGANDLRGTAWKLTSLSGSGLLPGTSISIEFSDNEVSGSAGCNHYGGSYRVSDNSLTIGDIFWTEMACLEPHGILEQEGEYLAALNAADSYQLTSDQLEILDETAGQLLVFVAAVGGSTSQVEVLPEQPDESETFITRVAAPAPVIEAPTAEVVEASPTPPADPLPGFKLYEDTTAGVSLFLPESWIVTSIDPGRWAILQSYPEDKYVGGEAFQPGDTKCDVNIHPTDSSAAELIQQWRSNPDTTIISEREIVLESGMTGTRLEAENRGRSLSMFIDVHDRAVVLTCFGEFEPFDVLAASLHESEISEDSASSAMDSPAAGKYEDLVTGVTVDLPESWVVTGVVPGHRAVLQSYPDGTNVEGEALQPGDTKCDLSIRPPGTTVAEVVEEMKANSDVAILNEAEIVLESGLPGVRMEIESLGRSSMMITEITGRVALLNCYGEFDPFDEIALTLRTAD